MLQYPERWLMLLALALYLFDAVLLLDRNQAMVIRSKRGWHASFGLRNWTISGREPWLANPLTGHRPTYQTHWPLLDQGELAGSERRLDESLDFSLLGVCVWVSTICLFVLLPLGLFTRLGSVLTLATILLITVNNAIALSVVALRRERFHLTGAQLFSLAVECLLCPPFSLNLVRRLCAVQAISEPLESIAARLFDEEAKQQMRAQCLSRIDDVLQTQDEDTADRVSLEATRRRFKTKESLE